MRSEGHATVQYDEALTDEQIEKARKGWAREGWHVTSVDRTVEYIDVSRGERIKGPETTTFYLDGEPRTSKIPGPPQDEPEPQADEPKPSVHSDEHLNSIWKPAILDPDGASTRWTLDDWQHVAAHFAKQIPNPNPNAYSPDTTTTWARWVRDNETPDHWDINDWRIVTTQLAQAVS